MEMPTPKDVPAVQRLLGLAQYLSNFLPHLSEITKPLRELTQRDTEWVWDQAQERALDTLKRTVSSTPVLHYYNRNEDVTLQCDASQSGLGAVLLQNYQPVAYASRAMTQTETRYAQMEKELLAIVFACDHFDPYIYGRDVVHIETDHQPLVSIAMKPLDRAPHRHQRMLQKYALKLKYKKGKHIEYRINHRTPLIIGHHQIIGPRSVSGIYECYNYACSTQTTQNFYHPFVSVYTE